MLECLMSGSYPCLAGMKLQQVARPEQESRNLLNVRIIHVRTSVEAVPQAHRAGGVVR